MKPLTLLFGMAPWVLFSMIADRLGTGAVGWAALAACLGSLVLAVRGAVTDGLKVIDAAGVVTFGALAAIGLASGPDVQRSLVDYGRGGAALVLGTVMLVSAFTVPFTEQYARASIDRRYWGSPAFRAVNRRISLLWAGIILVMAVCHLLAGALGTGDILLNWVIPVLLVLGGLKCTEAVASAAGVGGGTAGART
ncbi:hypothetical protein [Streptomyces cucumeris]|uniref:hypothetical protein n=1 Tax=Streptomyces cucumeris TaxID=2962890 RepID=UPI0020C8D138|nr:hypothetical protein [Streptomyces sp. NEAU-Y11]MCP9206653.1 hypothetical protein [Streptomyces sp. NEAU-Y11]